MSSAQWLLPSLIATVACGHGTTCTDPAVEAMGVAWDRVSGHIAYARWENPLSLGESRGCVFLIDAPARRIKLLRDAAIRNDTGFGSVGYARNLAFRRDASTLTFSVQNMLGKWELHDLLIASGREAILFPAAQVHHLHPSWSVDGRLAYYANGYAGAYEMIDDSIVFAGAVPSRVAWASSDALVSTWSTTASPGDLYLVNLITHATTPLVTGTGAETYEQPALSADGKMLAYVRRGSGPAGTYEEELWIADADGRNQRRLTTGNDDQQPAWSSDGRRVLFNRFGQGLFLYDLNADAMLRITQRQADYMAWQP
jgi:Tol biopolymer transport system component